MELEAELRAAVEHDERMGLKGAWLRNIKILLDTLATLRSDNERLGRERDSEHQLRIRLEIQRDEANAYGDEEAKRAQSAEAERDTLLAQVEMMRSALEPFAWVGQWLFARDLPDDTPIVTIQGLGKDVHLTRGMFKAAHTAALTKEPS